MPLVTETDITYHAHPAWSKSKLWAYDQYTPYRAEFGAFKEKDYLLFGRAGHVAVLEPDQLESRVFKSDVADRRGKKWDAAKEEAGDRICLLPSEWDLLLLLRDLADDNEWIRRMRAGKPMMEQSCYAVDPDTGADIKCRVDHYSPDAGGMLDLKFLASIDDNSWAKDLGNYGYMMQDAAYNHVWNLGSGYHSEFMIFACFSKTEPPEMIVRQLEDVDVEEGMLRYKAALEIAEKCRKEQHWPGQPTEIVRGVKMLDRDRRYTPAQWKIDAAAVAEGDDYE